MREASTLHFGEPLIVEFVISEPASRTEIRSVRLRVSFESGEVANRSESGVRISSSIHLSPLPIW